MASEAAKIQSHFYCPCRRRYIGPLPSCFYLSLLDVHESVGGKVELNDSVKHITSFLYISVRESVFTYGHLVSPFLTGFGAL